MAIIDNFPALTTPTTGDEIPIERGTTTYKIDYNALATAIINMLGGDPVTVAHGGTNATTTASARANIGATTDIYIPATDNTIAQIYAYLNQIELYHTAAFYCGGAVASVLTDGKLNGALGGVVTRTSANVYRFMVAALSTGNNLQYVYTWAVTNLTDSAITVGTVYRHSGTAI